jgi:hypothetical protein
MFPEFNVSVCWRVRSPLFEDDMEASDSKLLPRGLEGKHQADRAMVGAGHLIMNIGGDDALL